MKPVGSDVLVVAEKPKVIPERQMYPVVPVSKALTISVMLEEVLSFPIKR